MTIERPDAQTIVLRSLTPLFCELLHAIAPSAEPGNHPAARARIYSSPSGGTEPEFDADWHAYVEPDLRALFRSNLDIVAQDLRPLPVDPGTRFADLRIPIGHAENWVNALNQARLTLATRHNVTEQEMESEPTLDTPRGYAIFQIFFYGFIQECFLREMDQP